MSCFPDLSSNWESCFCIPNCLLCQKNLEDSEYSLAYYQHMDFVSPYIPFVAPPETTEFPIGNVVPPTILLGLTATPDFTDMNNNQHVSDEMKKMTMTSTGDC